VIGGANDNPTGPRAVSDELADDMELLGLADEIAEAPRESDVEEERYEIWPDNWPTLRLFLRLHSKWNIVAAPDGELVRTGIWWPNIEGILRNTNGIARRKWPEVIADLEAMEDAAMRVMNAARAARRRKRQEELEAAKAAARNSR
jgi:hypothetical protein